MCLYMYACSSEGSFVSSITHVFFISLKDESINPRYQHDLKMMMMMMMMMMIRIMLQ